MHPKNHSAYKDEIQVRTNGDGFSVRQAFTIWCNVRTSERQDYRAFLASLLHWSIRFYNPRLYFDEIVHLEE